MRNLLLTLFLLAPLVAAAESDCESLAGLAKSAAKARDVGVPLKDVLSRASKISTGSAETDKTARNTILEVYSNRSRSPDEFEAIYLSKCTEPSPEQQPAQPSWRT